MKEQQSHNQEGVRKIFQIVFRPLDMLFNTSKLMFCVHSRMRESYPTIWAWTAHYFEDIHLQSIQLLHCTLCIALKSSCGEQNSSSWKLQVTWLYSHMIILAPQGDMTEGREARQYLEHQAVGTSKGVF
jgi:hypothetical protein